MLVLPMRNLAQFAGLSAVVAMIAVIVNELVSDVSRCPTCGSRNVEQRPSLVHPTDAGKFMFWRCGACDLMWDERL